MELKDLFSEWYALVDPGFTGERISSRLSAISKIANTVTPVNVLDLVLLFYGQNAGDEFTKNLRGQIRNADETYVSRDQAELAIIAAGILYTIFAKHTTAGHLAALLILSGEFGGLRGSKRVDAVVMEARSYLTREGSRLREEKFAYPNLTELLKGATKKLQMATKDAGEANAEPDVRVNLGIEGEMLTALKTFGTQISRILSLSERRRLEESSILYWLLGARTLAAQEPFEEIEKARLCLISADDLAIQTQHIPGPASARAILSSVLSKSKAQADATVEDVLKSLKASDGERLLQHTECSSAIFMPISFALEKAREVNWSEGWQSAFSAQTKFDPTTARNAVEISEHFYRELLIARLLREA